MKTIRLLVCLCCVATFTFAQGFNSVHSPNGVDVWAVGRQENIFHSFDGGITWGFLANQEVRPTQVGY
jgi:photosystem II stability/assembly factor-like uncharacterized protein